MDNHLACGQLEDIMCGQRGSRRCHKHTKHEIWKPEPLSTKCGKIVRISGITRRQKLAKENARLYHHIVAKLFYSCRHTMQDIQMVVVILCTSVQIPDEDNYKNLTRFMQYLHGTKGLMLTIEPNKHPSRWANIM